MLGDIEQRPDGSYLFSQYHSISDIADVIPARKWEGGRLKDSTTRALISHSSDMTMCRLMSWMFSAWDL